MEVKEWTYEEIPEFEEVPEGAQVLDTTGDEVSVRYLPDVVYAEMDGVTLHLQILQPFSRNNPDMVRPCIVYVQGSAWFRQDVYGSLPDIARLADRGYVVAVVEYRHSGIAAFPAQIMDARNAVRFLRKNAAEYHLDPDNIFMAGNSSGGHTAMFAGMLQDETTDNLYPGISADVKGIIDYYGSTSVMAEDSNPSQLLHCLPDSPEGQVMGHVNLLERPELARKLSVECNITEETPVPPTLIIHGTKDRTVNCTCSAILYQKLKECRKDARLLLIKGGDHGGAEFFASDVLDQIDRFAAHCIK